MVLESRSRSMAVKRPALRMSAGINPRKLPTPAPASSVLPPVKPKRRMAAYTPPTTTSRLV